MRTCIILVLLLFPTMVFAGRNIVTIDDPIEISTTIHQIPTQEGDLGGTMAKYGLKIKFVQMSKATSEDVQVDTLHYMLDDEFLDLIFDMPLPELPCPIMLMASFVERKGIYIPENLTANWLINRICRAPD